MSDPVNESLSTMSVTMRAKAALRRLTREQLEPTPENYARAYAAESGLVAGPLAAANDSKTQGPIWAAVIERVSKGLARGNREWTSARRFDSLQRVLDSSRSDAQRLQQRLQALVQAWEAGTSGAANEAEEAGPGAPSGAPSGASVAVHAVPAVQDHPATHHNLWRSLLAVFNQTVAAGLPPGDARARELAGELAAELSLLGDALSVTPTAGDAAPLNMASHAAAVAAVCERVRRLFGHRHQLVEQLDRLCRELTQGLGEMAEDDSWARGQAESLQASLADGPSVRSVRAATDMLAQTRRRQGQVQRERQVAREALKGLLQSMLGEVSELGAHTGRFQLAVSHHAQAISQADSLQSLTGVVQAMLNESRAVTTAVGQSQQRLEADRGHADKMEVRVRELEGELRRLSEEVVTDALTQVANRRGLSQAFELERARCQRQNAAGTAHAPGSGLAVALIDIDNFKKLNDTLGHAAGDSALQALATAVKQRLRPVDHLARFGGEEFVVLLPGTALEEAQQALSRLQRELSASLFMHDGKDVLVTFSAGVTRWRDDESLQTTLERADEALYDAKRTGKNRTCAA